MGEARYIQKVFALTRAALERQKVSRLTKLGLNRARGEGTRLSRKPVAAAGEKVRQAPAGSNP